MAAPTALLGETSNSRDGTYIWQFLRVEYSILLELSVRIIIPKPTGTEFSSNSHENTTASANSAFTYGLEVDVSFNEDN